MRGKTFNIEATQQNKDVNYTTLEHHWRKRKGKKLGKTKIGSLKRFRVSSWSASVYPTLNTDGGTMCVSLVCKSNIDDGTKLVLVVKSIDTGLQRCRKREKEAKIVLVVKRQRGGTGLQRWRKGQKGKCGRKEAKRHQGYRDTERDKETKRQK